MSSVAGPDRDVSVTHDGEAAGTDLLFRINRAGEFLGFEARAPGNRRVLPGVAGGNIRDAVPPEVADEILGYASRVLDTGEAQTCECRLPVDEALRDFELLLFPEGEDEVRVAMRDVTLRRFVEKEIGDPEMHFRTVVENLGEGLLITDVDDVVLDTNSQMTRLTGYGREELLGQVAYKLLLPPEWWPEMQRRMRTRMVGLSERYEVEYRRKDGSLFWAEITGSPYNNASGETVGTIGAVSDITSRKRAEEALKESEAWFRAIFEQAALGISIADPDRRLLKTNAAYQALTGYSEEELVGKKIADISHPDDVPLDTELNVKLCSGELDRYQREKRYIRKDGSVAWVHPTISVVRDDGGEPRFLVGMVEDVTGRKATEQALKESERRFRQLFEQSVEALFVHDASGRFVDCNSQACRLLGYSREEMLSLSVSDVSCDMLTGEERERQEKAGGTLWQRVMAGEVGTFAVINQERNRRKDGTVIPVEVRVGAVDYGGQRMILTSVRDITERRELEERLTRQAFHDPLTGLPNRTLLMDRLEHALSGRRGGLAVLFLDLDNFKVVNDSLGHEAGDRLLVSVGRRLRECLRPSDTVARLGGDEFTVLLEEVTSLREAAWVAERILERMRPPFVLEGREIGVTPSIGIVFSDSPGDRPGDLLRNADLAMFQAKNAGKARYEVFEPRMHQEALDRLKLESDLRRAIDRDELKVCYQPKVSLGSGEVFAVEALVRWESPQRGLVLPEKFIPVAEETGLIERIGQVVLEEACRRARGWAEICPSRPGEPPLGVCVNLSARQFRRANLAAEISQVLRETGLDPATLILEVTESAIMEDAEDKAAQLDRLKDIGVRLAVDDFGTGYSSLAYLSRFPLDFLKIDRAFVEGLGNGRRESTLVSGIITLAHTLGMKVVAEGVENNDQLSRLRELGCDLVQGHRFWKPASAEAVTRLLDSGTVADIPGP